jgi:hypothetical protein
METHVAQIAGLEPMEDLLMFSNLRTQAGVLPSPEKKLGLRIYE